MEKKKALLLLTGGRGITDLLVIKYLHPDFVFNLTTSQGQRTAQSLQAFARSKFNHDMEVLPPIDPYNEQAIKEACRLALRRHPDAEWIIHFTSSPKVVGIYAYAVAFEFGIPYWFLDTGGEQIVSLVKEFTLDSQQTKQFFHASVEEYIGAYGRTFEIPKPPNYRQQAESWYNVAQVLAYHPEATEFLLRALRGNPPLTVNIDEQAEPVIQELVPLGALTLTGKSGNKLQCTIAGYEMLEFLKGDWLEVYVWQETINAGFADDCHWGYKIVADLPANELDLILTYKARLFLGECKTSRNPFDTDHLYKLHSVADLIGGNYVRQVFITNCPRPPAAPNSQFDNFCQQAKLRRITVITGEQLRHIGTMLKELVTNPKPEIQ